MIAGRMKAMCCLADERQLKIEERGGVVEVQIVVPHSARVSVGVESWSLLVETWRW